MALDQQYDSDAGAPNWVSILKTVYNIKKCDKNYTQTDMKTHSTTSRDILWQRCNGSLADLGFMVAAGMEDTNGEILAPTCSFVIADQVKRFICGDRFFVNHHPSISNSTDYRRLWIVTIFLKFIFTSDRSKESHLAADILQPALSLRRLLWCPVPDGSDTFCREVQPQDSMSHEY